MKRVLAWLTRYLGWMVLTSLVTLGGTSMVMLLRDWTLKSLLGWLLTWPVLALGMLAGLVMATLGLGRIYFIQRPGWRPASDPPGRLGLIPATAAPGAP